MKKKLAERSLFHPEILPRNPMDHVSRLRRSTRNPNVFTYDEITAIRAASALMQRW